MPAMVKVAAVLLLRLHEAPTRVIVAVVPDPAPVAVQLVKPPVRTIVGVDGMVKPDGKTTVIVRVPLRAPVELAVNPTVHVVGVLPATSELPANVTLVGAVAAAIVTPEPGLTALVSTLVLTLNVVLV
jgi:hypothetical protein